ncbi:MAG: tRNA (adenine(22)-N(1))-methyltransferase TrmK, partial [Oscillospiraceae bacterium]
MIKLNNRLSVCASFVSGKGKAVDVGTDHAFLSVFLVQSGKCSEVIACDVNERPLRFAEKTVETYKASD